VEQNILQRFLEEFASFEANEQQDPEN
jgi:hypothetical protein